MNKERWTVLVTPRSLDLKALGLDATLAGADCEIVRAPGPHGSARLSELWQDADAAILGLDTADGTAIGRAARLKVISRYGVGFDNVDLAAATLAGVLVTITPNALQDSVADFTLALMLTLSRGLERLAGGGAANPVPSRGSSELASMTLGLIGLGRIGRAVAKRARAFGMHVVFTDPAAEGAHDVATLELHPVSLEDLLQTADVVSLHVPLTAETVGLIGATQLELMKPSAFLVNTARGGLIDEAALARSLRDGRLAGAALDVRAVEPVPPDDPLREIPGVILTPHIASKTTQSVRRMGFEAVANLLDVKDGRLPSGLVNLETWNRGLRPRPGKRSDR